MIATIQAASIAYDDVGSGDALLLIHAGIANRSMWESQVAEFSRSHRVIACDLRGSGESSQPGGAFAFCDDIHGLLDYLEVDQAAVVGVSFGGNVALDFALGYPERVKALALISTLAAMTEPSDVLAAVWRESDNAFENGETDRAVAIEMAAWIDCGRSTELLDSGFRAKAEAMIRQIWIRATVGEEQGEERKLDPPANVRLGEIRVPVFLIQGDHELPDVPASMRRLADGIPRARSYVIANCSHLAPLERPMEFNRLLREFLEST